MFLLRYTALLILMSLIILSSSNASPTAAMPVAQYDMIRLTISQLLCMS